MDKQDKVFESVKKWWGLHNKCVVFVLALILVFAIGGWIADRMTDSYRYLGTASIVVSIALSLAVIGYTLAQNVIAHTNAERIRGLIERLEQRVLRVGEDVKNALSQNSTQVTRQEDKRGISRDVKEVGKGDVFFSLKTTSNITRLFAFFLLKSYDEAKPLPVEKFVRIVDPVVKMSTGELSSHVYGMLHGMFCCLKDFLIVEEQTRVQLKTLPKNFREHLGITRSWMIKGNPPMEQCLSQIENMV